MFSMLGLVMATVYCNSAVLTLFKMICNAVINVGFLVSVTLVK